MDTPPVPPAIVRSLEACGLKSTNIEWTYDVLLKAHVATIAPAAKADTKMFGCIREVAKEGVSIDFADETLAEQYSDFDDAQWRQSVKSDSIEWLRAKRHLTGLPPFASGDNASSFSAKIERFCGFEPGEAIRVLDPTIITLRNTSPRQLEDTRSGCVMHALIASDLDEHGIMFGFVGNAASQRSQ